MAASRQSREIAPERTEFARTATEQTEPDPTERIVAYPSVNRTLAAMVLACLGGCLVACGIGPNRVAIESIRADGELGGGRLEARPGMVAYRTESPTHAEVLATDLSIEQLDPAEGFEGVRGQITRVRMFTRPIAGKTPLSNAAGNAVVQHAVINDGVLAVYGGAGLLRPSGRPGDDPLAAMLRDGTVRLTRASGGLGDPIGTARVDLSLTAELDAPLARLIAARLDQILEMTQPVQPDEPGAGDDAP